MQESKNCAKDELKRRRGRQPPLGVGETRKGLHRKTRRVDSEEVRLRLGVDREEESFRLQKLWIMDQD